MPAISGFQRYRQGDHKFKVISLRSQFKMNDLSGTMGPTWWKRSNSTQVTLWLPLVHHCIHKISINFFSQISKNVRKRPHHRLPGKSSWGGLEHQRQASIILDLPAQQRKHRPATTMRYPEPCWNPGLLKEPQRPSHRTAKVKLKDERNGLPKVIQVQPEAHLSLLAPVPQHPALL